MKKGTISLSLKYLKNEGIVRLMVSDTGTGITPEVKARLFEPYFSTKKAGTGLGLAIVNSIVSDHNATISVVDNVPCGVKFIIDFSV